MKAPWWQMRVPSGVGFSLAECDCLSLAELLLGREKSFLPVGECMIYFFMLDVVNSNKSQCDFRASHFHFKYSYLYP